MMRSLIAIAALVASASTSAGELDGKHLVCTSKYGNVTGIEFTGGKAIRRYIVSNTAARIGGQPPAKYRTSTTEVRWDDDDRPHYYAVNRKTLKHIYRSSEVTGPIWNEWDCELSPSRDAMMDALNAARDLEQQKIDEQMKDNKI